MSVALEFAFEARVRVAPPLVVGASSHGLRRIVPILGGLRHGPPEVLERIFRGEAVDPADYYFRTVAELEAPLGRHDWLNKALFLGEAERRIDEVIVRFHRVS